MNVVAVIGFPFIKLMFLHFAKVLYNFLGDGELGASVFAGLEERERAHFQHIGKLG